MVVEDEEWNSIKKPYPVPVPVPKPVEVPVKIPVLTPTPVPQIKKQVEGECDTGKPAKDVEIEVAAINRDS